MPITISAGVVEVRQLPFDLTILVKKADKLMYKAKRTGKNRLMFGRMGK